MEGLKTYRHFNNPLEEKIHDIFVKEYAECKSGVAMELQKNTYQTEKSKS